MGGRRRRVNTSRSEDEDVCVAGHIGSLKLAATQDLFKAADCRVGNDLGVG